eukprot:gene11760-12978_t
MASGFFFLVFTVIIAISLGINSVSGQQRMFPYNTTHFIQNQDDAFGVMELNPGISFEGIQHTKIYVYTNGYITLGVEYSSAIPVLLGDRNILAPYWTDLDFRNSSGGVAYSQHKHTDTDSFSQMIINKTSLYISARTNVNFSPTLVILVTWIKALPKNYFSSADTNETVTFQLHLAINNINKYASFIYEVGGMLWNGVNQVPQAGISFQPIFFLSFPLGPTGIYPFYRFDTLVGNTGRIGEWLFDLVNFPPLILTPRHLILTYGEVNNFQIKATSPTASALIYSINGTGTSAMVISSNGNVSLNVSSLNVTMTFIVKDGQGNANKFSAAHGIGVGLGVAGLIVISVAVAVIYKRRKQNQGDITKHVKPVSNENFEMEA